MTTTNLLDTKKKPVRSLDARPRTLGLPATEVGGGPPAGGVQGVMAKLGLGQLNPTTRMALVLMIPLVALVAVALPALLGAAVQVPEPLNPGEGALSATTPHGLSFNGAGMAASVTAPAANTPAAASTNAAAGNAAATANAAVANAAEAAGPRKHILEPNQNLSDVSMRYYGTTVRWREIQRANHLSDQDVTRLRPGIELTIPDVKPAPGTPGNPGPAASGKPLVDGLVPPATPAVAGTPVAAEVAVPTVTRKVRKVVVPEQHYSLKPGDTVYNLATRFYDNISLSREIRKANPGVDFLNFTPGTGIVLPAMEREVDEVVPVAPVPGSAGVTPVGGTSLVPAAGNGGERTYRVEAGDNLTKIAQKMYGSGAAKFVRALEEGNRLTNPDALSPGQLLRVPAAPR